MEDERERSNEDKRREERREEKREKKKRKKCSPFSLLPRSFRLVDVFFISISFPTCLKRPENLLLIPINFPNVLLSIEGNCSRRRV